MKNTKTRIWWLKLGMAIILSNIFFFVLFSGEEEKKEEVSKVPEGWVEIQLEAQLLTPFQTGKKILIVQRRAGKKIEGVLQAPGTDELGRITVLVKENEANELFQFSTWEILPYLRHITFQKIKKEQSHEIRY